MGVINLVTYNVRGMNTEKKRYKINQELHLLGANVVFLQETYVTHSSRGLASYWFPEWRYGDASSVHSGGVAIGFDRTVRFEEEERLADPRGRFLFVKGKMFESWITLANIYAPNRNPESFLKRVLVKLESFKKGRLIVAGDLNMCMDPEVDTSRSELRSGTQGGTLKKMLNRMQLIDAWRISHLKDRDYTFFSQVHKSFSRLDYILIEHQLVPFLKVAEIKAITLSDHAPVKIQVEIAGADRSRINWKLNDSLMQYPDVVEKIEQELKSYFKINDTEEISRPTLWEAYKTYIRGIWIVMGTRKKKERGENLTRLYREIQETEQSTRPRGLPEKRELIKKRRDLNELLEKERKCAFDTINRDVYREGNKPGKWMARRVREKKNRTFIPKIRDEEGNLEFSTPKIAKIFHSYYSALYDVGQREGEGQEEGKNKGVPSGTRPPQGREGYG